jgi:uncharacterized protein YukE
MDEKRPEQSDEGRMASGEGLNDAGSTSAQNEADRKAADDLSAEVTHLAETFARAVRAAWQSDQRKQLESDLSRGLRRLVDNVEEALVKFNRSEQGQDLREQAERVVEKVRSSKVTEDLRDGLTKGLGSVAAELQEFADRMEERSSTQGKPGPGTATGEAQDIPVEHGGASDKEGQSGPNVS